jgi:hypothetical protein
VPPLSRFSMTTTSMIKKKPAEAGGAQRNSSELSKRKPLHRKSLKWKPLKPSKWKPSEWKPLHRKPCKRKSLKPLTRSRPKRYPSERCKLNMFNIQFTSLVRMVHQFPIIPGIYRHAYVAPPPNSNCLTARIKNFSRLVTSSCISASKRYQQDEQHEDNQKHHCPTCETTKHSSIVHAPTPPSCQMLLGYACLTA